MSSDINSLVIIGRLTRDCEVKALTNTTVCNFSIAVNRRVKKEGVMQEETSFFDIELYGKLAEALHKYLLKGRQVTIQGSLRQNRWEQDGQKRSRVTVVVDNLQLLGGSADASSPRKFVEQGKQEDAGSVSPQENASFNQQEDFKDDIPF